MSAAERIGHGLSARIMGRDSEARGASVADWRLRFALFRKKGEHEGHEDDTKGTKILCFLTGVCCSPPFRPLKRCYAPRGHLPPQGGKVRGCLNARWPSGCRWWAAPSLRLCRC